MHVYDISGPADIRQLSIKELEALAAEIRAFLIESISRTGGHLSSNLGIVELTLALHVVFDSPRDRILFDVGHQSYVHKILTGRARQFSTLRQYKGLSGFQKRHESEHGLLGSGTFVHIAFRSAGHGSGPRSERGTLSYRSGDRRRRHGQRHVDGGAESDRR